MVILAVIALVGGVLYGLSGLELPLLTLLAGHSDLVLYLLMFLVGISIGLHEGIWAKIKQYHITAFLIPIGIIAGSLVGGAVCAPLLGFSLGQSTMVASGLGWYSLAGVAIGNLAGARLGSIAFLSNLMREMLSFFCIPLLARFLGPAACIAAAGATSEDTTLPMMMKYTNEESVVLSVLNGAICSALVPVLISLCYQLF